MESYPGLTSLHHGVQGWSQFLRSQVPYGFVYLKHLNENVLREVHPLPKVDDTLVQLTGASVFSKLDANSGFWQIPLSHNSRLLTTFITPFGRFGFNKLPFGISSAPEHFQHRMNNILAEMEGVLCHMDNVLIFG